MSTPKRVLIEELIARYPDEPTHALSRLLHERYPHEFTTKEKARSAIRYYTGKMGAGKRKHTGKATIKKKPASPSHLDLKIRKGERGTKKPLIISTPGRWWMSSDWHVPYHDERALETAIRWAVDSGAEHLYLNGDLIDFYQSSNWEKDPRKRNLEYERTVLWEVLDMIAEHFPGRKVYKIGNHEHRFTRRMYQLQPELSVLPEFTVDSVLHLKERGFEVVASNQHAIMKPSERRKTQGLHVFHGHELAKGFIAPVNISRGLFLKTNTRSICGHYHRASAHVETAGVGDVVITTYSLGCLCDLAPGYAPVNKWNHGSALVDLDKGAYRVSNTIIDRGQVYPI